jgi:hypothetical protein
MKNIFKSPVFLIVLGLFAGWGITRLAYAKNWSFVIGNKLTNENCDTCFTPALGSIPGVKGMSVKEAQVGIQAFNTLSAQLKATALDSAGHHLWDVTNNGGFIPKDLMRTLLGSLDPSEEKIGFYYGIDPITHMLGIYFGRGTADCTPDKMNIETQTFNSYDVLSVPGDSSTSCPPNCPGFVSPLPPMTPPTGTGIGPGPGTTPPDSTGG